MQLACFAQNQFCKVKVKISLYSVEEAFPSFKEKAVNYLPFVITSFCEHISTGYVWNNKLTHLIVISPSF